MNILVCIWLYFSAKSNQIKSSHKDKKKLSLFNFQQKKIKTSEFVCIILFLYAIKINTLRF